MPASPFFNPNDLIFNKSYKEWVVKWWQQEDNDQVFLLPGTFEDTPIKVETVTIDKNKALLLSPINYFHPVYSNSNVQAVREKVKWEIDIIDQDKISVIIDGQQLGPYCSRVATDVFDLDGIDTLADGYWLFLKPLSEGKHSMTSFGTCRSGKIQISDQKLLVCY
jgi:hypothetical protein